MAHEPLRLVLVSRRPAPGKWHMARQLADEAEVIAMLRQLSAEGGGTLDASSLDVQAQEEQRGAAQQQATAQQHQQVEQQMHRGTARTAAATAL